MEPKTTLIEALIPLLKAADLQVAVIKHAHHNFDIDHAQKDSFRLRKAGADQMLISSRYRHALICETPTEEADLQSLIHKINFNHIDLLIVEGFKSIPFPKIELHRQALNKPWRFPEDSQYHRRGLRHTT